MPGVVGGVDLVNPISVKLQWRRWNLGSERLTGTCDTHTLRLERG
jgi:hypothetical protein